MPDFEPLDPKEQLNETDYSTPSSWEDTQNYLQQADRSATKPQWIRNQKDYENSYLNLNNRAKSSQSSESIEKKENTAGKSNDNLLNPLNYTRSGKSKNSALDIKAKIRRRIFIGILSSLGIGGGIGLGLMSPTLLLNKIADVIEKKFLAPSSMSMSNHAKNLWKCKLSATCLKSVAESSQEKSMGEISDEAKAGLKDNGASVEDAGDGASKIVMSEEPKTPITSDNIEELSPKMENEFQGESLANSPSAVFSGEPTAAVMERTGAAKNIPTSDGVGNNEEGKSQTIQEQLDEQAKNQSGPNDLPTENAETVSPDEKPSFVKASDTTGSNESDVGFKTQSSDIDVESAKTINTDAEDDMKSVEKEAREGAAEPGSTKALQIMTGVACGTFGASSIANGFRLGVKLIKIVQLSRFAMNFLTVADSIRANDGSGRKGRTGPTAEQFTQLANQITTVMKDGKGNITTKSGTDSFGYQMMNGDLTSSGGKFNITNISKASQTGQSTKFTSSVLTDGNSGMKDPLNVMLKGMPGLNLGGTANGLINLGCAALPGLFGAYSAARGGGILASIGSTIASFGANPLSDAAVIANVGSVVLGIIQLIVPGKVGEIIGDSAAISAAAGACLDAANDGGTSWAGCIGSVLMAGGVIALPFVIDAIIKNFESTYLKIPLPVGDQAMDAITSGAGAAIGMNAGMNGNAPLTNTGGQATSYLQQVVAYNQRQNEVLRANTSPFDIYNNATFFGSITGNFVASLYSNGNQPLGIAQSLLGMFGSSFGNFANVVSGYNPVYAATADMAYTNSCGDVDIRESGIAADPFCNPIYGLPKTLSVEDTMAAVNEIPNVFDNPDKVYGLSKDAQIKGGTVGDFLNECITRQIDGKFTPMGSGTSDKSGKDCVVGDTDSGKFDSNQMLALYNFVQYQLANSNINQGSELGSQADGSARSGKSSGTAAIGSIADVAKTMAVWGDSQSTDLYNFGGGHGDTADLKARIDAKFQPNSESVDCSGFVRAVIFQATGTDVGSIFANGSAAASTLDGDITSHLIKVDPADAQAGDLFSRNNDTVGGGHTGVILSNDKSAQKYETAESYGGHGPGLNSRTYDEVTVYRYKQ